MSDTAPTPISAGAIAKELGVSEAKVKTAIKTLELAPALKRGVCNLYDRAAIARIKETIG